MAEVIGSLRMIAGLSQRIDAGMGGCDVIVGGFGSTDLTAVQVLALLFSNVPTDQP